MEDDIKPEQVAQDLDTSTWLETWIASYPLVAEIVGLVLLILLSFFAYWVTRRIILPIFTKIVEKTKTDWDDIVVDGYFLHWLSWIPVTGVAFYGSAILYDLLPNHRDWLVLLVQNVSSSATLLFFLLAVGALLTAINEIYSRREIAKKRPIKSYVQIIKIFVYVVGGISVLALLFDQDPWRFLAGIGAMTAIVLLIFKDTILSLVASIQLTSNDMVRVGDWVEMPQLKADGDVIDVSLHTVKVQNWDKTITTIPTHRLISDSFKNWRGMQASGGRRIKRSISLDLNTVGFLSQDELTNLRQYKLLAPYLAEKESEVASWNQDNHHDSDFTGNFRRLSNLGTFRAYIVAYLRAHPRIHQQGMTFLVRQLAPGETGVPIEIYCFTTTVNWVEYEGIQSDIFDHFLSIVQEFGLRVFQSPAGSDFARLTAKS
jgi:miniconductance mechanosensitive channel